MSYLEPMGGHTSSDDRSAGTGGDGHDGPDDRSRARHAGAAPDPYAADPTRAGVPDDADGVASREVAPREPAVDPADAPDPYAAFRRTPEMSAPERSAPEMSAPERSAPERSAPEPWAPNGRSDGGPATAERPAPDGRPEDWSDASSAVEPVPSRGSEDAESGDDGAVAYPWNPDANGPAWDAPTAATSTAQAEYDLAAASKVRGRRRAGRAGRPMGDLATPAAAEGVAPRTGRAGRNLPAAIAVGAGLGALVIVTLFTYKIAFLAVVAAAACVGIWEMARAIRVSGARPPLPPLLGGGLIMIGLAWYAGTDALTLGLVVTVLAAVVWRLADGPGGFRRDLTAILLITVYVPFLLGFGALLAEPDDGAERVLITLIAVVLSDTGGYAAGVFLGKHPMAPRISPKKSWEGFGGSVVAAALGSAVLLALLLDVPFYQGALFGVVIAVVAVVGDLTESMMKRDLGIKDMSQLLPGHGGLMDRLDSVLFAVPTAFLLLTLLAPVG